MPPEDDLPPTGEHRLFEDDPEDFAEDQPGSPTELPEDESDPFGHRYPPRPQDPDDDPKHDADAADDDDDLVLDSPASPREEMPWYARRRATADDADDPATGQTLADADAGPLDSDERRASDDTPLPHAGREHLPVAAGPGDASLDPGDRSEAQDLAYVDELAAQAPDLIPTGEEHTPDEIHERRVASHKRHRRNGRIRLLAFVVIVALIAAFVVTKLNGGTHHPKATTSHGSPVAALGTGPSHLALGTPSALPGNLLIADRGNHRLVVVSPSGQVIWEYPNSSSALTRELYPDFAFFTSSGREIAITEEGAAVIDVLDIKLDQSIYRYGDFDVPGSARNRLSDPSAALRLHTGQILAADIRNCRVIVITPPAQHVARQIGETARCTHKPPSILDDPTTAFPTVGNGVIVNELNGHAELFSHAGKLLETLTPPGFAHTSMTAEIRPGVYISVEHTHPGSVEEFTKAGAVLWRYTVKKGAGELADPSLAAVLPSGDVLVSDDYNDRVIVIDPHTDKIIWQYGHRGKAGSAAGYLSLPVGIDLVKPYSLLDKFPNATPPR